MAKTITKKTKGKAKKKRTNVYPTKTKEGKELIPFVLERYLTHILSNYVACMQIMRFNNNYRSRTNISYQHNFPFYNRG